MTNGTGGERVARVTEEEVARIFSSENMNLLLKTIRLYLEPGKKKLVYLMPQANRIGQFALEAHALYNLFSDDHDELLVVINSSEEYHFSQGMLRLCAPYMRFIESPDSFMTRMGFFDGPTQDFGLFTLALMSADQIQARYHERRLGGAPAKHLRPSDDMDRDCRNFLDRIGMPEGTPIITLHARDPGFMSELGYHSHRNCTFDNYRPSIDWLLEQGYWIFRLGDASTPPIEDGPAGLVDLPHQPDYRDLLDACLIARSDFMIGCSSGPSTLAHLLGTPLLLVNNFPQSHHLLNTRDLVLFKHFWSLELARDLSYPEILDRKLSLLSTTADFTAVGLKVRENTPEELLAAVREMRDRLHGDYKVDPTLDSRFRALGQAYDQSIRSHDPDPELGISPFALCYHYGAPWTNHAQSYLHQHPEFMDGSP